MAPGEHCTENLTTLSSGVNLIGAGIPLRGRDSILIVVSYRENWDDFPTY